MKVLKDPVERLLYISLAVVVLCVFLAGAIIAVELNAINKVSQSINNHMNCVGLLLAQQNRANLRIQDLNNCKVGE